MNLEPLRHRAFLSLWLSGTITGLSAQLAGTVLLVLVQDRSGDVLFTGAVGAATAAATVAGNLLGGQLADRRERRTLVRGTTALAAAAALGLALGQGDLRLLFALVTVQAFGVALGSPARRTYLRRVLPPDQLGAGVALLHVSFQAALLAGPALGAVLLTVAGPSLVFGLDAAAGLTALFLTRSLPPARGAGTATPLAGLTHAWRLPVVRTVLLSDLAATVLAMPVALFPVLAAARLGATQGAWVFITALAVGGLAAGTVSGRVTSARHPLRYVVGGGCAWGLALAAFGLADGPVISVAVLVLAGAADTVSVIARGTLVQQHTPEEVLGRVSALEAVVGVAGPGLGNARAGAVASLTNPALALTSGGIACLLAVLTLRVNRTGPRSATPV